MTCKVLKRKTRKEKKGLRKLELSFISLDQIYLDNSKTHHVCYPISSSWCVRCKKLKLTVQQFALVFNKLKYNEQITYLTVVSHYYHKNA